ncbi:hypothetical protein VSDG_03058 [Cytospora chrysosperma]|uniref:RNase III domain-containing protein n=1 Tax=Cytospora chrysosperma TaxID=252740 RepID=A0A423W8T9_CYTCH|nr:hypothetical protein VSDG_03058 [Valsa sordida]
MASLRGWARTASTASKLASVEQIIGYKFKSVERLYEALDQEKTITLPNGEERPSRRTRNTRLALVGDAAAQFHLASQWYDMGLDGMQWIKVRNEGLNNNTLGQVGFAMGLDKLTVPGPCDEPYDMASTVEAILGAVYYDGGEGPLIKVMARCGISHKLLVTPEKAWTLEAMRTRRNLPNLFFTGQQWEWQAQLFRINPKVLPRDSTSKVVELPLSSARQVLETIKAGVEARKVAEDLLKKRKEEKAKRAVELEAERQRKEASKKLELMKQRLAADKEKKAAEKAKLAAEYEATKARQSQQPSLWHNLKRMWLGSDMSTGSNTITESKTQTTLKTETTPKAETISKTVTVPKAVATPKTVTTLKAETTPKAETTSNIPAETNIVTGSDTVAGSDTASGSDTTPKSNTGAVISYLTNFFQTSETSSATAEEVSTKEMPVLTAKQRKSELSKLKARIKSLNKQKQSHAQARKRSRRKGTQAAELYEVKMTELTARLDAAKQSLHLIETTKPAK